MKKIARKSLKVKIISPEITSTNKRCVYKMYFEDGSFYIGSTRNLRTRISGYKNSFARSIGSVNKLIAAKASIFDTVWFEIIEIVPADENPRTIENIWILRFANDPNSLNRSRSAFSNSGMVKSRLPL